MIANHPLPLAAEVARMLDADPVMAGQVKEHLSEERLAELIGLTSRTPLPPAYPDYSDLKQLFDELGIPNGDVLQYVISTFPKNQILRALNEN